MEPLFDCNTGKEEWIKTATEHTKKWMCCGTVTVETKAHTWKDNVCEVCGFKRASSSGGSGGGTAPAPAPSPTNPDVITIKDEKTGAESEPTTTIESIVKDSKASLVIKTNSGERVLDNKTLETIASESKGNTIKLIVIENSEG